MKPGIPVLVLVLVLAMSCGSRIPEPDLYPVFTTSPVSRDSDDPAIWINRTDPASSLVLGTDKGLDGALFVFDLEGREIEALTVRPLARPNNVDVEYGLQLGGIPTDIAVVTERAASRLRVYSLPDMSELDGGTGIPVFEGQVNREPMGIALYRRSTDDAVFAIVSRKDGPSGSYLWQYRLTDDGNGRVKGSLVRAFGTFSGSGEIESIAVDDELGYVYYSDERAGIRKYQADPSLPEANRELAFFGYDSFKRDREGISIYSTGPGLGYLIVSDQQGYAFNVYPREGASGEPHTHRLITKLYLATIESDGSEVTSETLTPSFQTGLFVAMSDDKTFHYYSWEAISEFYGLDRATLSTEAQVLIKSR